MLEVEIAGLKLKNPTILASGILGTTGSSLRRVAKAGAGAVVSKSAGIEARVGHKNPTVVGIPQGLLNAVGLSNPGIEEMAEELEIAREGGVPVIASVYGFSVEDYVRAAAALEGSADAIELNLSCPNVEKAGNFFGKSPELALEAVREVKKKVKVPVFAKLTAEAGDIVEVAKACEEAKADAIVAINTIKAMTIDIDAKRPILGNKVGGLSGTCIKPIAVRCVYEISREVSTPVIGCGGVVRGEDALEFIMAGAEAVQIGTGVLLRGVSVFRKVSLEMREFLEERNLSLEDIRGVALR